MQLHCHVNSMPQSACCLWHQQAMHSGEFTLSSTGNRAAYNMAGLSYDTKFDLKRAIDLPYTSEWFAVPPAAPHGQTPKLDTMHPFLMLALQATYRAAMQGDYAEASI